ncbi:hypothetical protein EJB05_30212, partial [Eragrostis curvula]
MSDCWFDARLSNMDARQEASLEEIAEYNFVFYNYYAKGKGFGVRKDKVRHRPGTDEVVWRRYLCSCHGYRDDDYSDREDRIREPRKLTRCGCPASLVIEFSDRTGSWYVRDFVDSHDHPMLDPQHVFVLRSHRVMKEAQKAEAIRLSLAGLRPCQIMDVMEKSHGGAPGAAGFLCQDMYNFIARQKKEKVHGSDAEYKQKQRRRTKDNFPNWPDPKQSTSDDYMIKPSDYETIEYMKQASADNILVDYGNFRCNKKELGCLLNPTEFINSETANVTIRLLKEKWYKREREDGSVYLETAYASKMLWRDGTPTDPKEKTEEDEQKDEADQDQINFIGRRVLAYLKHDMVFLPVNITDSHWYVAVLNARKREIQVLDSLNYAFGLKDLERMLFLRSIHVQVLRLLEWNHIIPNFFTAIPP